jgi:hypothetical protein
MKEHVMAVEAPMQTPLDCDTPVGCLEFLTKDMNEIAQKLNELNLALKLSWDKAAKKSPMKGNHRP